MLVIASLSLAPISSIHVHRSPKDAASQSGKPMLQQAQLIPEAIKVREIAPVPTPISFIWNPVTNSSIAKYTLYYGTNHASYLWTTNVPGTNATITVTFPKGVQLYAAVTATSVSGLESDYSNEARVPDWPYNGVVVSWSATNQPLTLQTSQNLRSWVNWRTGLPPLTNSPMTDALFFRAVGFPVLLSIQPLRLLDTNVNHYGG